MLETIINYSLRRRGLVLALTLVLAGLGVWNFTQLPIDAVPDITNIQVTVTRQHRAIRHWKSSSALVFR